ncbi:DsbA family protein [Ornithinimicrobium kibberense]|uniref:DsbA family protein n=2 Tax=Ornithinimicrobium kibberense TaxID=282060 RepID=A0ABV5V5N1_9MICO|nr:thioredoxin domain-containing protein [Ornithinimicrobium kibberense]
MSEPISPAPPAGDRRTASIAWAVAVIVVALVSAFIAWLAIGGGGSDGDAAGSDPSVSAPPTTSDQDGSADDAAATGPDDAAATGPSAEVAELMMGLQRRDADDPLAVGDVDAPVVMIEYADYRCPYCARFELETRPQLQDLVDDGTLRIEFRDFVIFGEESHAVAVAVRAAAEQGAEHGLAYQEAVFARSTTGEATLTQDDLVALAEEVGVPDVEAFTAALDDPELAAAVDADTAEARSLGLSSTPTFLVNTAVVQGAESAEHFRGVVAEQLEQAGADG